MRASRSVAAVVSVSFTALCLTQALGPAVAAAAPLAREERCVERRMVLAAKAAAAKLRCHAKAMQRAAPVDPACLDQAHARMVRGLDRLAARACPEEARTNLGALLGQTTDGFVGGVLAFLDFVAAVVAVQLLRAFAVWLVLAGKLYWEGGSRRLERLRERVALECGNPTCADDVSDLVSRFLDDVHDVVGGTTTTSSTIATTTTVVPTTTSTTTSTTTTTLALVDFVATPLSGPGPLLVTFTNLSSVSAATWHWDFGDGATSNAPQPVHQYLLPGVYTVSLSADGGPPVVRLQYVQVF